MLWDWETLSQPHKGGADLGTWSGSFAGRTGSESNLKLVVRGGYHHAAEICTVGKDSLLKYRGKIQWNVNPPALGCIFPEASLNQMGCEVPFVSGSVFCLSDGCLILCP